MCKSKSAEKTIKWEDAKTVTPSNCGVHLIAMEGFVTIGVWHSESRIWVDASANFDVTYQVDFWAKLPELPM